MCSYKDENDERLRETRKRKVEALQEDSDLLNSLLDNLRRVEDLGASQIVSSIRNKASRNDIKSLVVSQSDRQDDSQVNAREHQQRMHEALESSQQARDYIPDEVQSKAAAFDDLVHSIQYSSDIEIKDLIQLIQDQTSTEGIIRHAQKILAAKPNSTYNRKNLDRNRGNVLAIESLTDVPLVRVPAKPWTDVTDDNDFVAHLISVYFTWFYSCYPCVDQSVFVKAMISGDESSQFCSRLLVNVICMMACVSVMHAP